MQIFSALSPEELKKLKNKKNSRSGAEEDKYVLAAYTVDADDNLCRLEYVRKDNIVFFDTETLGTVILAQNKIPKPEDEDTSETPFKIGIKDTLFVGGIAAAVFIIFLGGFGLVSKIRRRSGKKKEGRVQNNDQG